MRTGAMMGGLVVAAITSTALSLFHELDATVMIRVWNLGTAALITRLSSMFGGGTFCWMIAATNNPTRRLIEASFQSALIVLHSGTEYPGESGLWPDPDTPAAGQRVLLLRCSYRAGHEVFFDPFRTFTLAGYVNSCLKRLGSIWA